MRQAAENAGGTPVSALRRWAAIATDHNVYMELDYGFAGVIGDPDKLPPRLVRQLDEWMQNLIRRCREEAPEERWLRLKFHQRGHVLRMECEAPGSLPEVGGLRNAGAYLETQEMDESFWLTLEAGLTIQPQGNETLPNGMNMPGAVCKEEA